MKKHHISLAVSILILAGCAQHTSINTLELSEPLKIDQGKRSNDVWIVWSDGSKVEGDHVSLDQTTIYWTDVNTDEVLTQPISEVTEIVYFKHPAGAWDGFRIGSLVGIALGVYAANTFANDIGIDNQRLDFELSKIGAIYFGFWGSVIATPLGFVIGERNYYELNSNEVRKAQDTNPKK